LIESGENGEPKLVYLVYLVYLVCLVGRTGESTKGTRETKQTGQTRETRQTSKEPRCVRCKGIRRRLIAEGTAVEAEGIVQAVRLEGASSPEGIGRRIRIERIRAQLAEILRPSRSGTEKKQKEEPHEKPPSSTLT
jgi:hypothetical protein